MGDSRAAEYMKGRRILEVNPDHPIVAALAARVAAGEPGAAAAAQLLFDAASLTGEGGGCSAWGAG